MGSYIIKAIQAFSKTERAQRLKAAIKAYQGYGETPNLERDLDTIGELLVRHIDPEIYSEDDVQMAIESHYSKEEESQGLTQWWDRELKSLDQVTDEPTLEEIYFDPETVDDIDFAMFEFDAGRTDRRRA